MTIKLQQTVQVGTVFQPRVINNPKGDINGEWLQAIPDYCDKQDFDSFGEAEEMGRAYCEEHKFKIKSLYIVVITTVGIPVQMD